MVGRPSKGDGETDRERDREMDGDKMLPRRQTKTEETEPHATKKDIDSYKEI